jgi:hypothetical protein
VSRRRRQAGPHGEKMFALGWELGFQAAKEEKPKMTEVENAILGKYQAKMRRAAMLIRRHGNFMKAAVDMLSLETTE